MAITVVANTPATAAAFNNLVPTYYRQASDQALATTTFTDHNTFTALAVAANTTWEVYFQLSHNSADAGNDIKVRLESTGTVTLDTYRGIVATGLTSTGIDGTVNSQSRALTDSVSGGSTISATTLALWTERFILLGGASGGTWGVEWAQSTATSGSTTVKAGSYLIMRRLV